MITNNQEIGDRIKSRRKELKITVDQIAEDSGLTRTTIYRYETGAIKQIKLAIIERLAEILKVNPEWIIGKSDLKERRSMPLAGADRQDIEKILDVLIGWLSEPDCSAKWRGDQMDVNQKIIVMSGLQSVRTMVDGTFKNETK